MVDDKVVLEIIDLQGKDLLKMKLGFLNKEIETFGKLIKKHKGDYNKAVWEYLSGSVFSDKEQKRVGLSTELVTKKHRAKNEQFMDILAVLATNQIEILERKYPLVRGQEMEEKKLRKIFH